MLSLPSNTLKCLSIRKSARIRYLLSLPSIMVGKPIFSKQNQADQAHSTRDCSSSFALAFLGRKFSDPFDHNVDANTTAQRVYLLYEKGVMMVMISVASLKQFGRRSRVTWKGDHPQ